MHYRRVIYDILYFLINIRTEPGRAANSVINLPLYFTNIYLIQEIDYCLDLRDWKLAYRNLSLYSTETLDIVSDINSILIPYLHA